MQKEEKTTLHSIFSRIPFTNKGKIKKYLDNQKLRGFIGSKTIHKNTKESSSDQQRNPEVYLKKYCKDQETQGQFTKFNFILT